MRWPKSILSFSFLFFLAITPAYAQQQHDHSSPAESAQESQEKSQDSERPWLGVTIQEVNPDTAKAMGLGKVKGVMVADVAKDSPADDAGLMMGDIITKLNGKDVTSGDQFVTSIRNLKVGNTVALEVNRAGSIVAMNVALDKMPEAAMRQYGHMMMPGCKDCPAEMAGMSMPQGGACPGCVAQGGQSCAGAAEGMGGGMGMAGCGGMSGGGTMGMGGPMDGCMMGGGMGSQGMMGHHMGMMGGEKYGKMYLMAVKNLDLTPDQKKKSHELFSEYKKRMIKSSADIKVAEVELKDLLASEPVNLDKVKTKINDIGAKKSELRFFRVKSLEDFKKILTPEQRNRLKDMMAMGPGGASSEETPAPETEPAE